MKANDLKIGNLVCQITQFKGNVVKEVAEITEFTCTLYNEKNGSSVVETKTEVEPIPLTEEWLMKLPKGITYPSWIVFVHHLQNWFYYNNNKTELEFKE